MGTERAGRVTCDRSDRRKHVIKQMTVPFEVLFYYMLRISFR